jgi:hypothetical protein
MLDGPDRGGLMRVAIAAIRVAVLGSVFLGGSPAIAAVVPSTLAGGSVKLFATPSNGLHSTILMTGAIGGYGNALAIDKNGRADPHGNYVKVTLHKGGFEINSTALNAKTNNLGNQTPINKATCSMAASVCTCLAHSGERTDLWVGAVAFLPGRSRAPREDPPLRAHHLILKWCGPRGTRCGA